MKVKKQNIIFMLHLPPPIHGSSIVGEQVKNSVLINSEYEGRYINLNLSRKVNETGKTTIRKLVRLLISWTHLIGKLVHKRPNLCYYALTTTGSAFYKDCFLIATLKLFNVRILYHIHNKGVAQKGENIIYNMFYRFVFNRTQAILLSERLYFDVSKYISPENVYYCHNGIVDYQPMVEFIDRHESSELKILFLSNLLIEKGVYDLIDACGILYDKGYNFYCDFVGGEGDITKDQFSEYIKQKNLNGNISYLGTRYGKLKELSYRQADIFVLPTHKECFPLVLLEALQHSLPVISTFEGGIPDIVDEGVNGFLYQKKDTEVLAEKIESLLTNHELRKDMGVNARIKYEENFRLSIFERRLLTILNDVINK